jgi:hypothetical protein
MDNPFERYDLDPHEGIAAITQRLKELAEDAKTDAERERIRADWEELTLHPARRLRAALFAHPETRSALGMPPSPPRRKAEAAGELELRDLVLRPSVVDALGFSADEKDEPPSLDDDPVLSDPK